MSDNLFELPPCKEQLDAIMRECTVLGLKCVHSVYRKIILNESHCIPILATFSKPQLISIQPGDRLNSILFWFVVSGQKLFYLQKRSKPKGPYLCFHCPLARNHKCHYIGGGIYERPPNGLTLSMDPLI